jgi:KDO2-lipid IV(A) lauroyltransferase
MPGVTPGSALLTGLARVARVVPAGADLPLASGAARLANLLRPGRLAAARANAAVLYPQLDTRELDRHAESSTISYLRFLIEYVRSLGYSAAELGERASFRIDSGVRRAIEERRGVIVCAAHVGNWEFGAVALGKLGLDVAVVAGPQYAAAWRSRVRQAKRANGIHTVHPEESPRRLLRHLERGGAICLLVDGDGFARGRETRLFGRRVRLPEGPARLAATAGAVLAGALCTPVAPFRFQVELSALGGTGEGPVKDTGALHAAIATWLEDLLRERPGQWCIFRRFFEETVEESVAEASPTRAPVTRAAELGSAPVSR